MLEVLDVAKNNKDGHTFRNFQTKWRVFPFIQYGVHNSIGEKG
jgi:hypothetical protein